MIRLLLQMLKPGTRLMRLLRMPVKLSLLGVCLTVPMVVLLLSFQRMHSADVATLDGERSGLAVVRTLLPVVIEGQTHRALTRRLAVGDSAAVGPRDGTATRLRESIAAVDANQDPAAPALLGEQWPELKQRLLALADHRGELTGGDTAHEAPLRELSTLIMAVGERSGLLLDPLAGTYFAIITLVQNLPPWSEELGHLAGLGSAALTRGQAIPAERDALMASIGQLRAGIHHTAGSLAALQRTGQPVPTSWPAARSAAQALIEGAQEQIQARALGGDAFAFYRLGSNALGATAELSRELVDNIDAQFVERAGGFDARAWLVMLTAAIGLAAVLYLFLSFYLAFAEALERLLNGVKEVAEGDLSRPLVIPGRDELSRVGQWVDRTNERLSSLVAQVRSSAMHVDMAGRQVADGSTALSKRTEEQAMHLRQAVGTIADVSRAAAENAQSAHDLDGLARQLGVDAEQGGTAMADTEQSIVKMELASRRVGEVIEVIDDIAFQTGMLALNAAVEASRAGEAGRGFSVVATEVRALAQRCSESAEQIRLLVREAGDQVTQSASRIREVGVALGSLRRGVQDAGQRLGIIATASQANSQSLQEVSASIGNLDEITRRNAAMVEEATAAANVLVNRAHGMREAVGLLRLRQGSVDEAHELVLRGKAHVEAVGLEQALRDFSDPRGGYFDRDLYLFAFERDGTCLAFGGRPDCVGRSARQIPGLEADTFLARTFAVADQGGGWTVYRALNPMKGCIEDKESYIEPVGPHTLIGCGVYRSASAPSLRAPSEQDRQRAPDDSPEAVVAAG